MATARFPILFITASRVGDAVLSSGLVRKLSEEMPHARFTVVASPLTAPLFQDVPALDRLIALEKGQFSSHWVTLWRQVRGRRWGLVVDMRGSGLARFLNARRRAVHKPLPPGLEPLHKVVEAARVLKLEDEAPPPFLYTSEAREAGAEAMLAGSSGPLLAIAPATNWAGKTWPAERFAVVAAELLARDGPLADGRLLLLGGPNDRFAAEAVRRVIPRARLVDTVGRTDLLTAYALLKRARLFIGGPGDRRAAEPLRKSLPRGRWIDLTGQADLLTVYACLRRARLFIGNDSGLMHLAAAAGAPTLGLFGPSDERLYAPWGPHSRVLRGPRDFAAFKAIDPKLNQVVCHMFDLPTPWVTAAAKALLADTDTPAVGALPPPDALPDSPDEAPHG
jgi:ADP-heptose:LPS heptosyltransferase